MLIADVRLVRAVGPHDGLRQQWNQSLGRIYKGPAAGQVRDALLLLQEREHDSVLSLEVRKSTCVCP